jgi:flagellar basal-body rod protein FlgB
MSRDLFQRSGLDLLKRSLDAYTLRQKVIAENVAHVETPGYRSRSVDFETRLTEAMEMSKSDGGLSMTGTGKGHLPSSDSPLPQAVIREDSDRALDNGVNDVSMDLEMAALAETSLRHKMVTRILSMRYQALRSAVRGRG